MKCCHLVIACLLVEPAGLLQINLIEGKRVPRCQFVPSIVRNQSEYKELSAKFRNRMRILPPIDVSTCAICRARMYPSAASRAKTRP